MIRTSMGPNLGDIKPALYSVTYLGLWYRGEALSLEELLERARRFGYAGIEIEAKRRTGSRSTGLGNAARSCAAEPTTRVWRSAALPR